MDLPQGSSLFKGQDPCLHEGSPTPGHGLRGSPFPLVIRTAVGLHTRH